jgi:hypothetical protein
MRLNHQIIKRLPAVAIGLALLSLASCSDMISRLRGVVPPDAVLETRGTEFYVAFQNVLMEYPADPYEISLIISGDHDTTGQVTVPGLALTKTFSLTARNVARVTLPRTVRVGSNDLVENLGIRVTASQPVVVYGLNHEHYASDSFLALPVPSCGTEYYIMSYQSFSSVYRGSEFTIVCLTDAAAVTITPTVASGTHSPGVAYSVFMAPGQTYQLSDQTGVPTDMTGTHIVSDKPIAVFSGHRIVQVPVGIQTGGHLTEQLTPVAAWDTRYWLLPYLDRNGDTVRVLAAYDGTVVSFDGTAAVILDAGEFSDRVITAATVVSSDRPVLVAQFSHGSTYYNPSSVVGDPSMLLVPGARQFRMQYSFGTPTADIPSNYLNLIVPASAIAGMTLDGSPVSSSQFTAIDTSFWGARLPVSAGNHVVAGPQKFGLVLYGLGDYDAYANPGG